ncbi:hypothetical protein LBMAG46_26720 [Planctomycetia bacterium]|nr:hypothetical protein LBMAG46_26720 [Planctomycetia bacterium]
MAQMLAAPRIRSPHPQCFAGHKQYVAVEALVAAVLSQCEPEWSFGCCQRLAEVCFSIQHCQMIRCDQIISVPWTQLSGFREWDSEYFIDLLPRGEIKIVLV